MTVFAHDILCISVCVHVCTHVCMWMPEVNFTCLTQSLSALLFNTESLTEPETQWYFLTGWPVGPSYPPAFTFQIQDYTQAPCLLHRYRWLNLASHASPVSTIQSEEMSQPLHILSLFRQQIFLWAEAG